MGVPEGEGREKEAKRKYDDTVNENFPNLMKDMNINTQETPQTRSKMNSETTAKTHRNQTYKQAKDKERMLKTDLPHAKEPQ